MRKGYVGTALGQVHHVSGEGERLVILLHQGLRSAASFERFIPLLAPRHRGVAVDLPAVGARIRRPRGFACETSRAA